MIRRLKETIEWNDMCGGSGPGTRADWCDDQSENPPNIIVATTITLAPGASCGYHMHEEDSEIVYFVQGKGIYNDNGTEQEISAGDITFCYPGEMHGFVNTGDEDIIFYALVIKE